MLTELIALTVAALLLGNEFGTWGVVHRQLARLPVPQHVAAEQALHRGYGMVMPVLMSATILVGIVAGLLDPAGRTLFFAGAACFVAMLAVTFVVNIPINNATVRAHPDIDPGEWRALRRRWSRGHDARVALDLAGYCLYVLAALQA